MLLFVSLPIWIPLLFLAFFAGRRQFSLRLLLLLITLESVAFGICPMIFASAEVETWDLAIIYFFASFIFSMPIGAALVLTANAYGQRKFGTGFWLYLFVTEFVTLAIACAGLPTVH